MAQQAKTTPLDTIAAQATPPGSGGMGVIRISGSKVKDIANAILHTLPSPRHALYTDFFDSKNQVLDRGIALYFTAPNSFSGEDVLELQAHGGILVLDLLLQRVLELGARPARPGEFSERAFLNNKLDLTQAEAIADLINSSSVQAARCAMRSLQGEFSNKIHSIVEALTQLRVYIEAAIDFPEEEIDFLTEGQVQPKLNAIFQQIQTLQAQANQGSILREGMTVVIAGRPNAGKSSLLNVLAGQDRAIVTSKAGTTRDVLHEHIQIDGMPVHIIDTAGLREDTTDEIERIGMERAWQEIHNADLILLIVDSQQTPAGEPEQIWPEFIQQLASTTQLTLVRNKADLSGETIGIQTGKYSCITLSAKQQQGVDILRQHLKQSMGFDDQIEGTFMARRRHLDALNKASDILQTSIEAFSQTMAGEFLAEDLKQTQQILGEITGTVTSDQLLGNIFSSFCIGK